MTFDVMADLSRRARLSPQRVIFPEALEDNIMRAARQILDNGVARPCLVGQPETLATMAAQLGVSLEGIDIVDDSNETTRAALAEECRASRPGLSLKTAERKLRSPLNLAAFLVASGRADAMVAGLAHTTQDVILAGMIFIGMREGISTPSSLLLMRIPGFAGPEEELIVFADCAVTVAPSASELAEIALTTADTARVLLGWEPRVAMISFSTRGSGDGASVDRVREALEIARSREPELAIDGEFQVDAAIVPAVAARKVVGPGGVAGRANILVFPDLDAGNVAYKCVQRFAGADAFGPFLQGFARTISDLSRGSSVADIVGVATMASVHAQGWGGRAREPVLKPADEVVEDGGYSA
jgi:phosphate acetyltransferase